MKRLVLVAVLLVMVLTAAIPAAAQGNPDGMPNGPHYNLNIIGVPKDKNAADGDTTSNGRRIFVDLDRTGEKTATRIDLIPGDTFAVIDYDGTDGTAKFQLPIPATCDPNAPECLVKYQVWARALGTPGGHADMYTCATDPGGVEYCSVEEFWVRFVRDPGRPKWMDVTKELLFVSVNIDADLALEHVPLFYSGWTDFYWQYDNYGMKLAQLRFYPGETTVIW